MPGSDFFASNTISSLRISLFTNRSICKKNAGIGGGNAPMPAIKICDSSVLESNTSYALSTFLKQVLNAAYAAHKIGGFVGEVNGFGRLSFS